MKKILSNISYDAYSRNFLLIFWVGLLSYTAYGVFSRSVFIDVSFIVFRYTENFAEGKGLLFNPGERVEGYTDFLWVFIIGILKFIGISPVTSALYMGILSCLGTVVMTYKITLKMSAGVIPGLLASAAVASSASLLVWSGGGLETGLYTFLLTASLFRLSNEFEESNF